MVPIISFLTTAVVQGLPVVFWDVSTRAPSGSMHFVSEPNTGTSGMVFNQLTLIPFTRQKSTLLPLKIRDTKRLPPSSRPSLETLRTDLSARASGPDTAIMLNSLTVFSETREAQENRLRFWSPRFDRLLRLKLLCASRIPGFRPA